MTCERCERIEAALPKLGDGVLALPGMAIFRDYLCELWEAKIVGVHFTGSIDIQYTNDANHRSKNCTRRAVRPEVWHSTKEAAIRAAERKAE